MAVRNADKQTVTVDWDELSGLLSKTGVLLGDEDIKQLTLINPCKLLIHTVRRGTNESGRSKSTTK